MGGRWKVVRIRPSAVVGTARRHPGLTSFKWPNQPNTQLDRTRADWGNGHKNIMDLEGRDGAVEGASEVHAREEDGKIF